MENNTQLTTLYDDAGKRIGWIDDDMAHIDLWGEHRRSRNGGVVGDDRLLLRSLKPFAWLIPRSVCDQIRARDSVKMIFVLDFEATKLYWTPKAHFCLFATLTRNQSGAETLGMLVSDWTHMDSRPIEPEPDGDPYRQFEHCTPDAELCQDCAHVKVCEASKPHWMARLRWHFP